MGRRSVGLGVLVVCAAVGISGCSAKPKGPVPGSGNDAFDAAVKDVLEDTFLWQPTSATYLGIHKYDYKLEDYSNHGVSVQLESARRLRAQVDAIDARSLSPERQLDRDQVLHALDSRILTLD